MCQGIKHVSNHVREVTFVYSFFYFVGGRINNLKRVLLPLLWNFVWNSKNLEVCKPILKSIHHVMSCAPNVVFFSKQKMKLLIKHMSMCHMFWSVTGWKSTRTVIQSSILIFNFNLKNLFMHCPLDEYQYHYLIIIYTLRNSMNS